MCVNKSCSLIANKKVTTYIRVFLGISAWLNGAHKINQIYSAYITAMHCLILKMRRSEKDQFFKKINSHGNIP